MPLSFQKLSHKAFGGFGIAAALHQHVENEAMLIDSPPQPVFLAANGDDDLIEVPFVAKLSGRAPADFIRKMSTKFLRPKAHCLMETMIPRAASRSSTIRRLSGKRRYSQTAWAITSAGN